MPDDQHPHLKYRIHRPHTDGEGNNLLGYDLYIPRMKQVFRWDRLAFPRAWAVEEARRRTSTWEFEARDDGGHVRSVARVGEGPTLLWFDHQLPRDHALYVRAELLSSASELVLYWNGDGHSSRPGSPWSLTLAGLSGWRAGYTGLEYLQSEQGGQDHLVLGTMLTKTNAIAEKIVYEAFVGTYAGVDFCFIDQREPRGPRSLVVQNHVPDGTFGTARIHEHGAQVAIGHTATHPSKDSELSVVGISVYEIPDAAALPWSGREQVFLANRHRPREAR